ncbi:MAG TPA: BMP family ABC transporter substrate-binding protein [Pseudonocardiaceae bacterium]|nr:BMP family ABC transporter substrate-binding protein [Pseudonocardiaceae bacterium]
MQRVRWITVAAGVATLGLVLGGCASKPTPAGGSSSSTAASASSFKACMVTDTGGIDDRSFNAAAWQGMQKAQSDGKATVSYVQSKAETDYAPNIAALESQSCKFIVTVGGLMGPATTDAANKSAGQHFAIIDSNGNQKNVTGLQYNTAQAGFLAGYLAAGYSKTGKVATYGGEKIGPVTIYMDGFWEGVQYYNTAKGKNVQVLGWSETTQNGSFTGSFTDQTQGQQLANNFIAQGADVIFPVAGGTGLGSAAVAQSTSKAVIIWVDTDGVVSAPQYSSVFLSTAFKNIAPSVTKVIEDASGGTFAATDYLGTLANGGVGLAPFHDFASKVDPTLQSELTTIKQKIISGEIKITSPAQPKV